MNEVTITVRYTYGTYQARAVGLGIRASCSSGEENAAHRCAQKALETKNYTLRRDGSTFIASRVAA